MNLLAAALVTAATGLVMVFGVRPVLLGLPEPAALPVPTTTPSDKIPYRALATPGFVVCCTALTLAAQAMSLWLLPLAVQPLWTVLATCGVLLAVIDAQTTWLPLRLTQAGWILMAVAMAAALTPLFGLSVGSVLRSVAGAAIAGVLYLVVWAITRGGFGFGDVRFAPMLGAASAAQSWTLLVWALTLGTAVGAIHGATRLLRRRRGGFPYAPSMLAGCYLAAISAHYLVMERGP